MVSRVWFKRGTRAQIDASALAGELQLAEPYLDMVNGSLLVGLSASTYAEMSRLDRPERFDIRRYGATTTTDCVPALAAAMAACAPDGYVYIPPGDWRFDSTINWDPEKRLKGAGRRATRLIANHNGTGISIVGNPLYLGSLEEFSLITSGLPRPTSTGHGIFTSVFMQLINVTSQGFGGHGVYTIGNVSTTTNANLAWYERVLAQHNGGDGFYTAGDNANAGTFMACNATLNAGTGFRDAAALGNNYLTCHAASNTVTSYWTSGPANASLVEGCYAETDQPPARNWATWGRFNGGSFTKDGPLGGVSTKNGAVTFTSNPVKASAVINTGILELFSDVNPSTIIDYVLDSTLAPVAFQRFLGNNVSGSGGFGMFIGAAEKMRVDVDYAGSARIIADALRFYLADRPTIVNIDQLLTWLGTLGLITDLVPNAELPLTPLSSIKDLGDVAATAPTAGQVLAWSGTEYAPVTPGAGPTPTVVTLNLPMTGDGGGILSIADPGATATKTVMVWPLPFPDLDTAAADPMVVSGSARAGFVDVAYAAAWGTLCGTRKFAYQLLGA
jgi:hypothetical protein